MDKEEGLPGRCIIGVGSLKILDDSTSKIFALSNRWHRHQLHFLHLDLSPFGAIGVFSSHYCIILVSSSWLVVAGSQETLRPTQQGAPYLFSHLPMVWHGRWPFWSSYSPHYSRWWKETWLVLRQRWKALGSELISMASTRSKIPPVTSIGLSSIMGG